MNKFIPKNIKQSDFIKGITQMFNLYITPDNEVSTKLNIVTRDEYYDSGVEKDWTYNLAKDKAQDIKFLPEIVNKKLLLTYNSIVTGKQYSI